MTNLMLVQLAALSAHLHAVQSALEQELGGSVGIEPGACPTCQAPADKVDVRQMLDGTKHSVCQVCGAKWDSQ